VGLICHYSTKRWRK